MIRQLDHPISCSDPAWLAELARRIKHRFVLKTIGICAFIWLFFICYFHLLRNPVHPVIIMPVTALDRMIPLQHQALIPYLSLWLYLGIAPGLMLSLRNLLFYAWWISKMCVIGLLCFYLMPTAVPPLELDVSGHAGIAMLQGVDANGNACPSLHVATAIFTAIWLESMLQCLRMPWGLRAGNAVWFIAIAYSTLATKQHVMVDVLMGVVLGGVFALAALRWRPKAITGAAF